MACLSPKISFRGFLWVLFYLLILVLLLKQSFSYLDPDFGWHLQVGQEIAESFLVPSANQYNYTFTGSWVDHEWLSNLIVYEIYAHSGYIFLSLIFTLLIIAGLLILFRQIYRRIPGDSVILIAIFQFIGLVACLPHFGVRIQELGWLFLIILLFIIEEYERRQKYFSIFLLIPLFYVWACLHGSFPLGLVLLLAYIVIKGVQKIWSASRFGELIVFNGVLSWHKIIKFSIFTFLAFSVTLLTPYGTSLYDFLGGYANTFYLKNIQEWLPQYYYPFQYFQILYLAISTLGLIIYVRNFLKSKKENSFNLWRIFLFVIFFGLSFKSRRHFPLFFVATLPLVVESYTNDLAIRCRGQHKLSTIIIRCFLVVSLMSVIVALFFNINFTNQPFVDYNKNYPGEAIKFLRQNKAYSNVNIFNHYGWGGYLIRVWPEKKLFIDGRLPQVEFSGHTFLEEYYEIIKKDANFKEKLERYNIGLVLLPVRPPRQKVRSWEHLLFQVDENEINAPNYLVQYLEGSSEWQKIYKDKTSIVFFKK